MSPPRKTYAEKEREAREEAQREAKLSVRLGTVGVVVLFASGVGAWLATAYVFVFLGTMVLGVLLILVAFLMMRESVLAIKQEDRTKVL